MKPNCRCPYCEADQEPEFQVCCSCGRELKTGRVVTFETEPAQPVERLDQFDLKSLILNTAAAAMVFQMLTPTLAVNPIRIALFILGAGYLSLKLSIWILFNLAAMFRIRSLK